MYILYFNNLSNVSECHVEQWKYYLLGKENGACVPSHVRVGTHTCLHAL